jgi:SNF2 family DNA or RNA helicase
MSGTPITRDITGFWRASSVLDVRSFPDRERYAYRYSDRSPRDYGQPHADGLTTVNRQEFYTMMQGTMRYVSKRDVLKDLPDKTYTTRAVDIPASYRKAYDEMESDMLAHIPDTDEPLPVMSTLAQMQRLTQLASSACDVEVEMALDEKEGSLTYGEMIPHYKVSMREPCWKVDELMQVMEESGGEPILCFAPHTQLVNLAGQRAEKHGYRVAYITGEVNAKNKDAARHAFQAGELDLLCANVTAGGVGLTLTRSHTAVFLETPPAFWQRDQAEDRLHRAGQTEPVSIIDIVARNTIESRWRELMKDKAGQLGDLVRDPRIVRSFLGGQKIHV